MNNKPVIVIGAGIGGLTAALLLASRGQPVIVIEKCPQAGGKMREIETASGPVDSGPTVFTMRHVFEEIFARAGTTFADHVTLEPVSVLARHAWSKEEQLDLYADIEQTVAAISQFSNPAEGARYRDFCKQAQQIYQTLEQPFILGSRPSPITLAQRVGFLNVGKLWQLNPFVTLWNALAKHFHDARLQQLFGRYATYMGSSPYLAPATLMLIAHVEQDGVWLVKGGMYRLIEAMQALAMQKGVRFRFGSGVKKLLVKNNAVHAVQLENDETLEAAAVVFNGDRSALANGLLGAEVSDAVLPTPPAKRSLSAMTWSISVATKGFPLIRHNVFFSDNYHSEFEDIFQKQQLPSTPTVYVCAQDRDEHNAGQTLEQERLFCLVNAPAKGDSYQFSQEDIAQCQQRAFALLERCGLDVRFNASDGVVTTPSEFNALFPATGGALYGQASHGWLASFQRPGSRSRLRGLYLAGGSVHPGAGVPMAATSGRLAAETLLHDLGID